MAFPSQVWEREEKGIFWRARRPAPPSKSNWLAFQAQAEACWSIPRPEKPNSRPYTSPPGTAVSPPPRRAKATAFPGRRAARTTRAVCSSFSILLQASVTSNKRVAPAGNLLRQFCTGQSIQADPGLGGLQGQITMDFGRHPDHEFAAVAAGHSLLWQDSGTSLISNLQPTA